MYGGDITISLDGGSIIAENPQFIRKDGSGRNVAGLKFTLTNHTGSAWMSLDLQFDITYVCSGEVHQRSETVKTGLGWTKDSPMKREYQGIVIPLIGEVDACETESIKASLISARKLDNSLIAGLPDGNVQVTQQESMAGSISQDDPKKSSKAVEVEPGGRAAADLSSDQRAAETQAKNSAKAARRKRIALEQQRKQAEENARAAAKVKAEEAERAADALSKNSSDGVIGGVIVVIVLLGAVFVVMKTANGGTTDRAASNTLPSAQSAASKPPTLTAGVLKPVSAPVIELPLTGSAQASKWIGANECVAVAGFRIQGLVYVGRALRAIKGHDTEPALIDPSIPVAPSMAGFDPTAIPYWPSYCGITPAARHAYLRWHASGRSAADAPISFVFLYFYGLERRILFDRSSQAERGEEDRIILSEVRRMLEVYGGNHSFRRYASAFLDMAEAIHHTVDSDHPPPEYPPLGYDLPSRLKIDLGSMARDSKPIPPAWATAWICADPLFPRRTPFLRCNNYFKELFSLRYREHWGAGIVVKANKTNIRLEYQPASASFGGPVRAQMELPDITILKEPIGKLRELGLECMEALDAYSRYLGRNPGTELHPAAMALLPPGMLADSQADEVRLVRERLREHVDSAAILSRNDLLSLVHAPSDGSFAKREAVALAQYLASIGFGMEPDVRFGGPIPEAETKVYLFATKRDAAGAPTQAYNAAMLVIRLAGMVSAAEGAIGREEEQHLRDHISTSMHLSEDERTRLGAHLSWVLTERPKLSGIKSRIESLSAPQRHAIGKFLVGVANVDGHVSPNEVNALGKLYRILGLTADEVYTDVHKAATEPVIVQPSASAEGAFVLPARKQKAKPTGIQLDPAIIEAKLRETSAVSALLASVFVEEAKPPAVVMSQSIDLSERIAGLDVANSAFLRYLAGKPAWSRAELELAAAERVLLLDGSIEAINEAAFDACDERVLEGEDTIEINSGVLSALLERTQIQ
jgi:uncharacterized tellurite resistance protein B-like protein